MRIDGAIRILLIEDDERIEKLVRVWLQIAASGKFELTWCPAMAQARPVLAEGKADLVLLDLDLPDSRGLDTLLTVRRASPELPVIVFTGSEYEKVGLPCIQNGAKDYLYKGDISGSLLVRTIFFTLERTRLERENYHRLSRAAHRLVPAEILRQVSGEAEVTGQIDQKLVTVLFADLRGFTSISEQYPKQVVIRLLNHLLQEMTVSVLEEDGYLDKFLGDGLMAVFGAPQTTDNDWLRAVRAGYKIQARIELFNRRRFQLFPELEGIGRDIQAGIGIHSGMAMVGFIGTADRCEYTAIGDCVNVAARLCAEAQGGEILITRVVSDGIGEWGQARDWRVMQLKGKAVSTEVATLNHVRL